MFINCILSPYKNFSFWSVSRLKSNILQIQEKITSRQFLYISVRCASLSATKYPSWILIRISRFRVIGKMEIWFYTLLYCVQKFTLRVVSLLSHNVMMRRKGWRRDPWGSTTGCVREIPILEFSQFFPGEGMFLLTDTMPKLLKTWPKWSIMP